MVDLLALTHSPVRATFSLMFSPAIVAFITSIVPAMLVINEAVPRLAWRGKHAAEMWCRHDG